MDREKVINGLECCLSNAHNKCRYWDNDKPSPCCDNLHRDALELLKAQNEIIDDLIKVGYPHNFQREEPWIVNYMYAITDVIRKAVNLKNDPQ